MQIRIPGLQIYLRDWQLADLEQYSTWMVPGQPWKELDGPYYPLPSTEAIEAQIAYMRTQIENNSFPTIRSVLVISDQATDNLIGIVSWSWESEETHWPTIGIVIFDPTYWNQGIGFEALGLWSDYLFYTLPTIARLDLRTWSGNKGMMRLAEKLGYQLEARFRKARTFKGTYYDGLGYGVLREEWEARYHQGFASYLQKRSQQSA
ncbi:GNAT family N-acetyltransferase [Dictyobacter kobayashii]|uniref:Acetyltransferase n=1 Tax=Dictyobacter kobayashii TaxID=2014872 RepID=A0A402AYC0_9CHLR|nr:GNAT family protein [Dictyobacter kobayashii]GCE24053.1 acetyltransferase [Dictyobacter kobayashii]